MDVVAVFLAGGATALATGIGVLPVFLAGKRAEAAQPFLTGIAIGAMVVASIQGLLVPALRDGSVAVVTAGAAVGALFVVVAKVALSPEHSGARFDRDARRSILVFGVLFVHS